MQYVSFGDTGMKVSRFTLGTMTFGDRLDLEGSRAVLDEAIDNGVNFIDTADSYGYSEEIIGQILPPEKREQVFLATKVFMRFCREGSLARNSRVNIINSLERSLRLMKTDYFDLYMLHHPDPDAPIEETLSTLDNLVKQGKIRYYGVSNHYAWQMAYMLGESKAHGWERMVSTQVCHNIIDRQVERDTVPFCKKFNIAMMIYGPLCGGILSGKYLGKENLPSGSRAAEQKQVREYVENETNQAIVKAVARISEEQGLKMNQTAVLWLMAKPYVTTMLLGGSRPEHFRQIYEVADRSLPEETVQELDELSAPRIYTPFHNQPFTNGPGLARHR